MAIGEDTQDPEEQLPVYAQALNRYQFTMQAEYDQREKGLEDVRFAYKEESQWDDYTKRNRKDRPKYEINKIRNFVNQVVNETRQSNIGIKVRPRSGEASIEVAEVLNGLIRHIEVESKFTFAKKVAAQECFAGGFGAWQLITQNKDEQSFDNTQCIKIKPIHSAITSVFFDPAARDEFARDARYCFVCEDIGKEEFRSRYPGKQLSSLDHNNYWRFDYYQQRDTIRIADYWVRNPCKRTIGMFSDGNVREITDEIKGALDEMAEQGLTLVESKEVDSYCVQHYKISGKEVLEGPNEWAGTEIPVVPVYADSIWIDNQHYYHGVVRFGKDPQRLLNYMTSSKVEQTAVNPMRRLVTPRQIKGNEIYWESTNPALPLVYNPDPQVPGGAPIQMTQSPMNNALVEQIYQADADLQDTVGIYKQSLGDNPRGQSGKALQAMQGQADTGTFGMRDNFARAIERTGEILIDLIPKTYDTERQEMILNDEGEASSIVLNRSVYDDESGEWVVVENDLTLGKYEVVSSVGPSHSTQRQENRDTMAFITQTAPEYSKFTIPILLENTDSPVARQMGEALTLNLVREGLIEGSEKQRRILQDEAQAKQAAGPTPEEIAMQLELEKLKNENFKLAAEAKREDAEARLAAVESFKGEIELQNHGRQEALEDQKTMSEIALNQSKAEKTIREAREPISPVTSDGE